MIDDTPRGAIGPLAIVLLVTLSGCSAAGAPFVSPQPYTDSGADLDGEALRASHTNTLYEAGSFGTTTNLTLRTDDGTVTVDRTAAVDVDENRAVRRSRLYGDAPDAEGVTVASYTDGNTTARRIVVASDDTDVRRYDAARAPYDDGLLAVSPVDETRQANGDLVETAVEEVDWVQRGVERHDGGWVTRYEATGSGNVSDLGAIAAAAVIDAERARTGLSPDDVDATSVEATLLVSPDGVVRQLSLVVETADGGETTTLSLTVSTDGVGSTDVQQPAWYDEATDDLDD